MTITELKKANEVLNSNYITSIEIGFEYEASGIRYYTAVSYHGIQPHAYIVKVQNWDENGETIREIKCNCASGAKQVLCKHAIAVGKEDTKLFGIKPYLPALLTYKAHLPYETTKCVVCDDREATQGNKCRECENSTSPYLKNTSTATRRKVGGIFV